MSAGENSVGTNLNNSTTSAHLNVYKPTFIINNSYQPGQTASSNDLRNIDSTPIEAADKHHLTDPGMQKKSSKRIDDNRQLTSSSSNNGVSNSGG